LSEAMETRPVATAEERQHRQWAGTDQALLTRDGDLDLMKTEAELNERRRKFNEEREALVEDRATKRMSRLEAEAEQRRLNYAQEDQEMLEQLENTLQVAKEGRQRSSMMQMAEMDTAEQSLVESGVVAPYESDELPTRSMPPVEYPKPLNLPPAFTERLNLETMAAKQAEDEKQAERLGVMRMEDYDKVKREMAAAQLEREAKLQSMAAQEQDLVYNEMATKLQVLYRGRLGRRKSLEMMLKAKKLVEMAMAAIKIQTGMRGYIGRKWVRTLLEKETRSLILGESAMVCQKVYRGHLGRRRVHEIKRQLGARTMQRVYRGHLGRMAAEKVRAAMELLRLRHACACKIQSVWKMMVAREDYRILRVHMIAAREVQRIYRGHLGRRKADRRRNWQNAEPGPERLKLGLKLIEESKVAFERQQEEIDALHRSQEKAESRVSHIHNELQDAEKELGSLERELQEIDQIERDLHELTHERELLQLGVQGAAGIGSTGQPGGGMQANRAAMAESHALEIAIHRKRAERENRRQELDAEFAAVFREITDKKGTLAKLETAIADMEATRVRKDREFSRLQRNLMELLQEQKYELDSLREKGIELETATATSAAAASATAARAKEHEKKSTAMFNQTEELMKFQFMSMSLSYFSSLNMLKQMRDINSDTTSAAVSSSAETAAAAAAAAAAANIPAVKHLKLGAEDVMEATLKKKQAELAVAQEAEQIAIRSKAQPFPKDIKVWSVGDVGRWLDTLQLSQYVKAFKEASVDGEFLLELRPDDLSQVLGVEHKLHVRKVLVSRDKLRPLDEQAKLKKAIVLHEETTKESREGTGIPELDTVFSQARNGRTKRVEDSLNADFPVDAEDEKGNTLLHLASQNCNKALMQLLIARGANVNSQNGQGNTPLHFVMAYDTEGLLGEFLVEKGADDTIENKHGLSPYDGIEPG